MTPRIAQIQRFWPLVLLALPGGCSSPDTGEGHSRSAPERDTVFATGDDEPLRPLEPPITVEPALIELGQTLFHDGRLSRDGDISCASCHPLDSAGVDAFEVSVGADGRVGTRNAPTVFNAARNFVQFWDGRARTLEEQIDGPVHNPVEMATDWPTVTRQLAADLHMRRAFRAAFADDRINPSRIRTAIAAFERSLITSNSAFDRYLLGDGGAISARARDGYALFKNIGCASCHQGENVGGSMFQKLGVVIPYGRSTSDSGDTAMSELNPPDTEDTGRYLLTGDPADRYVFRVPSLRLAVATAPYFHHGEVQSLAEAVAAMAWFQLGISLDQNEIELIVEFLRTLPGEYDGVPICQSVECA